MDLFDIAAGRQGGGAGGGGKLPIDLVEKMEYFETTVDMDPNNLFTNVPAFVELEVGKTYDLHIEATTENTIYEYDLEDAEAINMSLVLGFEGETPGFYIFPEMFKDEIELPPEMSITFSSNLQCFVINNLQMTSGSEYEIKEGYCAVGAMVLDLEAGEEQPLVQLKVEVGKIGVTGKVEEKYLPVFQADMNENDDKNPAYVRNRTHYTEEKEVDYITFEPNFSVSRDVSTYPFLLELEVGKDYECDVYLNNGKKTTKTVTCTKNKVVVNGENIYLPALGGEFGLLIDGLIVTGENSVALGDNVSWLHDGAAVKIDVHGFSSKETIIQKIPHEYYDFQEFTYKFDWKKLKDLRIFPVSSHGYTVMRSTFDSKEVNGNYVFTLAYKIDTAVRDKNGNIQKIFDIPASYGEYNEYVKNAFNNAYDYRNIYFTHPMLSGTMPASYIISGLINMGYLISGREIIGSNRNVMSDGCEIIGLDCSIEFTFLNEDIKNAVWSLFGDVFDNPDYISIGYIKPSPPIEGKFLGGITHE